MAQPIRSMFEMTFDQHVQHFAINRRLGLLAHPTQTRSIRYVRMPSKIYSLPRVGFSLLEVILALAILGMSVGILSQMMKLSTDNAKEARALTTAQLLCESKMMEAISGVISLQGTGGWTQITDTYTTTPWYYNLQILTTEQQNMIGVEIQVSNSPDQPNSRQTTARLVRWIIDPAMQLDVLPEPTTDASATGTSSQTGSTSSTGTAAASGGVQ